LENARVGIAAQQVDRRAQAFLGKGALRHAQLAEYVCCASTNARIIRGGELKGFFQHLATAEPMQGYNRGPVAAAMLAIRPTILLAIRPALLASPVCGCGKQFGNRSDLSFSHAYNLQIRTKAEVNG
jgi:hypothetical protein